MKRLMSIALVIMMVISLVSLGTAVNANSYATVTFDTGALGCHRPLPISIYKGSSLEEKVPYSVIDLGALEDLQFYGWSLKKNGNPYSCLRGRPSRTALQPP